MSLLSKHGEKKIRGEKREKERGKLESGVF
jgi:hypothetical protein